MDQDTALPAQQQEAAPAAQAFRRLNRHWGKLAAAIVVGGAVGLTVSYAFTPKFESSTMFIPPQQQQGGGAAAALSSLGALSSLVGGGKTSTDQYISMMQSVSASDAIIKRFDLAKVYDTEYMEETRRKLAKRVEITAGKKDGLIRVEVEDSDPKRAAAIANQYVDELRSLTSRLAVTEAQQRRVFFEQMLEETKRKLVAAQVALESTGYSAGVLKVEPRSAAETYARLRAELTSAQVRLQVARGSLADTAPQVLQLQARVNALSEQVTRLESSQAADQNSPDYIGKYREFKYQETLFELFAKQYEAARVDEAREGSLIQVVDVAQPAERKSFPHRSLFAALGAGIALLGTASWLSRKPRPATA